jgi:type VI secretion system protein ImpE
MTSTEAGQLFRQGRLTDAIDAASKAVKQAPADVGHRVLLAEFLLFTGEFERTDTLLDAAVALEPGAMLVIAEFRQLLRAATARRQVAREGRVPEFLKSPTQSETHLLQALVAMRAGDLAAAANAVDAAEASRPAVSGIRDGTNFTDFRDADDLISGSFEVLTTTGKYFWIPIEQVDSIEFYSPQRPRDLFWRRCSMTVRDGPDGDVYLPSVYDTTAAVNDDLRLGRATDWSSSMPIRGSGQRVFLVGEDGVPINELGKVDFS